MFKTGHRVSFVPLLAIVLAVFTMWGCSEVPVGPSVQGEPHILMRSTAGNQSLATGALYAEKTIRSRHGGQLQLAGVILDVPPFAIAQDTLFSIQVPDAGVFFCEFGTSGLVFNRPVKVTISYSDADLNGVDESTIRVAYLNETTGVWEDLQSQLDRTNKVVVAYLNHFSAYGLISD